MTVNDIRKLACLYGVDVVVEEYHQFRLVFWASGDEWRVRAFLTVIEMDYLPIAFKGYFFLTDERMISKFQRYWLRKKAQVAKEGSVQSQPHTGKGVN